MPSPRLVNDSVAGKLDWEANQIKGERAKARSMEMCGNGRYGSSGTGRVGQSSTNDVAVTNVLEGGSSHTCAVLKRKNREVTLEFAAGPGPAHDPLHAAYSVCVWSLVPANPPAKSVTNRN